MDRATSTVPTPTVPPQQPAGAADGDVDGGAHDGDGQAGQPDQSGHDPVARSRPEVRAEVEQHDGGRTPPVRAGAAGPCGPSGPPGPGRTRSCAAAGAGRGEERQGSVPGKREEPCGESAGRRGRAPERAPDPAPRGAPATQGPAGRPPARTRRAPAGGRRPPAGRRYDAVGNVSRAHQLTAGRRGARPRSDHRGRTAVRDRRRVRSQHPAAVHAAR